MARRGRQEKAAELAIEVGADTERLDRELKEGIPNRARAGGEEAAKSFGRGFSDSDDISREARQAISRVVENAESTFRETIARADFRLSEGIIDEDEFRRTARRAVQSFNDEIADAERALERAGVSEKVRLRLINEMRETGEDAVDGYVRQVRDDVSKIDRAMAEAGESAGERFGREALQQSQSQFQRLRGWVRGAFAVGVLASFGFVAQRIVEVFRRAARAIRDLLSRAGERQQAEVAFINLTTERGMDPEETLRRLQRAARGTASEMEILQRTNEALQTGLPATSEQLAELVENSRRVGQALGKDADEAYRRFIQSIVRGRRRIIDDLGVMVDYGAAYSAFAAEVGKSTDELTEQEKIQARLNAVLEESRKITSDLGPETLSARQRLNQLGAAWSNLLDRTAVAIAESPKIEGFLSRIGDAAAGSADKIDDLAIRIGAFFDAAAGFSMDDLPDDSLIKTWWFLNKTAGKVSLAAATFSFSGAEESDPGRAFEERFEANLARRQHEARLERIQQETDVNQLMERRQQFLDENRESLQRISELIAEFGAEQTLANDEARRLVETYRALNGRVQDLQSEGEEVKFTQEEISETLRETDRVLGEMDGSIGVLAEFAQIDLIETEEIDRAKTFRDHVEAIQEALGEVVGPDVEGFGRGPGGQLVAEGDTERKMLQLARFTEDLNQQNLTAEQRLQAVQGEMDRLGLSVDDVKGSTSDLAQIVLRELLKALPPWAAEMIGIADGTEDADDATRDLLDDVRDLAQLAGGVLSLASAFGVFGDEAERALQKGVTSATQLVQGINSLQDAIEEGESGLALLGPIGGAIGGAAGLVGAIGGLFGDDGAERREQERLAAVRRNTGALESLRNDLDQLRAAISDLSGDLIERARQLDEVEVRASGNLASGEAKSSVQQQFESELAAIGLTVADLETLAAATDINLDNFLAIMRGDFPEGSIPAAMEEFNALLDAIAEFDLERALSTFEGRLGLLQDEFELLDIDDPIDQLQRLREVLLGLETELPPAIEQALAGADLSTPEGRRRFEQALEAIARQLAAGDITEGDLGGLSLSQFRELLGQLEGTLDEAIEGEGDRGGFTVSRGITETTGNRVVGGLSSLAIIGQRQLDVQRGILQALGGEVPAPAAAPSLAASALPPPGGGGTSIGSLIGTLSVSVDADVAHEHEIGEIIAEDTVREIDRRLRQLVEDRRRSGGRRT